MLALVHAAGDALAHCELTFVARAPIDVARARAQHAAYGELLRACGVRVHAVNVSPEHADAVFIEDAAVVLDELAVATSMGAPSRRAEVDHLLPVLATHRRVVRIELPATLEGGDVLRVGRRLFVGLSPRTNAAGAAALSRVAEPFGYRVVPVRAQGCLHLKTACTALDDATLLLNPAWVDAASFPGMRPLAVPASEPFAANVLRLGTTLCASASHPRTAGILAGAGYDVRTVDISELEKAEAGMTCLSVLIADDQSRR